MRELSCTEIDMVNGGFGILGVISGIGLAVSIPAIVLGAVAGIPTLGVGFIVMAAGIAGTAISGVGLLISLVTPIL